MDVVGGDEVGGVGPGPDEEEVVSEGVVAGGQGDALADGDVFRRRRVGDADVDVARGEVLDGVGGVAGVPGYFERGGAAGDGVSDEGI